MSYLQHWRCHNALTLPRPLRSKRPANPPLGAATGATCRPLKPSTIESESLLRDRTCKGASTQRKNRCQWSLTPSAGVVLIRRRPGVSHDVNDLPRTQHKNPPRRFRQIQAVGMRRWQPRLILTTTSEKVLLGTDPGAAPGRVGRHRECRPSSTTIALTGKRHLCHGHCKYKGAHLKDARCLVQFECICHSDPPSGPPSPRTKETSSSLVPTCTARALSAERAS
jgi:hypothetical protein